MLKQLGRMERTRNFLIIGFAILMAVSLVFFFTPGRDTAAINPATSTEVLAEVGGDEITVGDLTMVKTSKQNELQSYGGQFSLAQFGFTDKRFLDQLINSRVVSREAERLGLAASDAEVAEKIRKLFTPADGKFVGFDRYKERATALYGSVERFEEQVRSDLTAQKLEAFVTAGVRVSDEEVQEDYQRKNATFDLVYVPVTADELAQKIQPSDEELRSYFEQHKSEYRIDAPQKKVRYLYIDQAKSGEKLQIPDVDLRAAYDKLKPENKQAGVRVQQIVLKVARPDLDAEVKAKADRLVAEARAASGNVTEEKFAELARGNSEDPATAKNGGALSGVVKRNPNKPDDPLQSTLDMQEGAITEPIKFGNAYYILRRGPAVPKSFEDARQELLVSERNTRAYGAAAGLAQRAAERLKETKDLQKVAQEFAAEANMTPAEMVKETSYIKPGDDVPNIGSSQQFEEAVAPLNNANDVGERTPVKGGFAIPVLADKKEPRDSEFDEVKDRVADAVRQERARARLEQAGRQLAEGAGGADALKAAAERLGLEAQIAPAYKLGSPLGPAGTSPAVDDAIYNLKAGEVTKTPLKIGDNWVIVGATKRTEADLTEFAKQRDQLTQDALATGRAQVFDNYITTVQERMRRDGDIKIYNEVLAKLAEDEPPAVMPGSPNFPIPPPSN